MRRAAATALLALATAPAAAPAATSGPCLPGGPRCTFWSGRVVHVHDGDTLEVRSAGRTLRVRVTGIQAMEQTVYSSFPSRRRGECHAVAATNRLEQLVERSRNVVRLAAQDPSSRSGGRWRRSVAVRAGGGWRDVGEVMVAEGHALWLTNPVEWAWNARYAAAAERAAAQGLRLWDTDACGAGPSAGADLEVRVNWDADGVDVENPNGEWIRVANRSQQDVPIAGWWVRDSALRRFRFPSGAAVAAGGAVTVRVGRGEASGTVFHWGLDEPAFENPAGDGRGVGDGAYLFDPDGDLRAWEMYR
ncbi:MAG TPA: lamin tail domain-containing protein [Solirubrobacteraceae bacterium]|jgi:endonuclease YncB( thermonuclease family)|nr:lamin tail domain-containing protein [Solirubrobacteraceae bacterium]